MSPARDIFATVAEASEGLPVLVIGGHAINAYGYVRTTLDADFLVCEDDLPAWRRVFGSFGYRWQGQTEAFAKLAPPDTEPPSLPVDLMTVSRETFLKLAENQRELEFGASRLPVPQPLHLIALKLHAMRNDERRRLGRDLPDIVQIISRCGLDTSDVQFQQSFIAMPTRKPAPFSTPPLKSTDAQLFDLPDVPPDFREEDRKFSWREQMAHAQMLLSWRKRQQIEEQHPPRNPERFVMSADG